MKDLKMLLNIFQNGKKKLQLNEYEHYCGKISKWKKKRRKPKVIFMFDSFK